MEAHSGSIHSYMNEARRIALKSLSPLTRSMIIAIKELGVKGERPINELLSSCKDINVKCLSPLIVVDRLAFLGIAEVREGIVRLTDYGKEMYNALKDFESTIESMMESIIEKRLTPNDLYSYTIIPMASLLSSLSMVCEYPDKYTAFIALAIHAYVTTLVSSALMIMMLESDYLKEVFKKLEESVELIPSD